MLPTASRLRRATLALVLAASVSVLAQNPPERIYQLADNTSEVLSSTYRVAAEAKNYPAALVALDGAIAKLTDPTGYDMAILLQIKAQTYLQNSEFQKAVEPLERCIQLSDAKTPTYFDERVTTELLYYAGALLMQEGSTSKVPAVAASYFDRADRHMSRWIASIKKPTADAISTYASLIYTRATQDPEHPDVEGLKRALTFVDQGLRMATHPKDNLYVLKLVILQQLNRNAEATEYLELLVRQKPENRTYWQQLAALYLQQQQDIRAILTMERAQALGLMKEPKDNFNLIGIHFNIQQYDRAAELLEIGLKNGSVENEEKNWELLAFSYQQLNRDMAAIDALKRGTKLFPKSGQLEYLIAQNYYSLDKVDEAYPHLLTCVEKGGGKEPHRCDLFLAFIAFELKKFDVALAAAERAAKTDKGREEGKRMADAIKATIEEREAKKQKL